MTWVELKASDGHRLAAFRVRPEGKPRGAIVVVEEIFGVNRHIRAVASRYAGLGYLTVAPSLFDRSERGVELRYNDEGFRRGRELAGATTPEGLAADMTAAVRSVASVGRVGVVGYCFGGAVVWAAAANIEGLSCAVSYYGSRILSLRDLKPKIPVMMHVGEEDESFPIEQVREIAEAHDNVTLHEYEAGHGFNCDHREHFAPQSAAIALSRTLAFFGEHVG